MIRTIVVIGLLFIALFFLPVEVQLGLYVIAIVSISHRVFLLIPAIFSDVLYAPSVSFSFLYMTGYVGSLIILYWIISTKTRAKDIVYGVEKE